MLQKTRGIVINYIRYRESSLIAKIYTEEFGMHSCLINGVRSKGSKNKLALFQPLTLLDLIIYYKQDGISRISELTCFYPYKNLSSDPRKSAITFFIDEVLYKCLQEESANYELFNFLETSLRLLDNIETRFENFHIIFLIKLSVFLGFNPEGLEDLMPGEIYTLNEIEKDLYLKLLQSEFNTEININNKARRKFLDVLLKFFSSHVSNFDKLNSLPVLQEIMKTD